MSFPLFLLIKKIYQKKKKGVISLRLQPVQQDGIHFTLQLLQIATKPVHYLRLSMPPFREDDLESCALACSSSKHFQMDGWMDGWMDGRTWALLIVGTLLGGGIHASKQNPTLHIDWWVGCLSVCCCISLVPD